MNAIDGVEKWNRHVQNWRLLGSVGNVASDLCELRSVGGAGAVVWGVKCSSEGQCRCRCSILLVVWGVNCSEGQCTRKSKGWSPDLPVVVQRRPGCSRATAVESWSLASPPTSSLVALTCPARLADPWQALRPCSSCQPLPPCAGHPQYRP